MMNRELELCVLQSLKVFYMMLKAELAASLNQILIRIRQYRLLKFY